MNRIVPIIVGTAAVLIILGATFLIARPTYAAPFVYGVGGTGTTTPNPGQLTWWGTSNQKGVATTSVTCTGSTSCTSFTAIGSSPITITSSGGAGAAYPFTPGTFGSTNTSATSTAINDTVGFISTGTSTLFNLTSINSTTTNATSSEFAVTGSAKNCNGTSAITTSAAGNLTCTAQPQGTVTAVSIATANGFAGSSSGGATPALTITTSVTGLLLGNGTAAAAYGGSGACSAGTAITALDASGGKTCSSAFSTFAYPFTNTTFGLSAAGATTTVLIASNGFATGSTTIGAFVATSTVTFPVFGLTAPSNTATSTINVNSNSQASSSVVLGDGTNSNNIFSVHSFGGTFASSTLTYYGAFGAAGTTTTNVANPIHSSTLISAFCKTDVGTAYVVFGNGSASTTAFQCTATGAQSTFTTNNTWKGRQPVLINLGDSASAPNLITVSADVEDSN